MKKKNISAQLTSKLTFNMVYDDMVDLATNVYQFKNVPNMIDMGYVNNVLLFNGAIAWFYDDVLDSVLALPFNVTNGYDIYNRPIEIVARANNGTYHRTLKQGEFVIMYDNTRKKSIISKIRQRAERIALSIRTQDINIVHQRTPRFWKAPKDKIRDVEELLNDVDCLRENIIGYDSIDLDDISSVIAPAPYIVDKLDSHIEKEWASFYRLIGVASVSVEKRERLVTDEVKASQGGVVASRYSRYTPRLQAIEEINKKWNLNIQIEYYDGVPSDEKEVIDDVSISNGIFTK